MVTLLLFLAFIISSAAAAGDAPYKPAGAADDAPYKPSEHILLMCGCKYPHLAKNTSDNHSPVWLGDVYTHLSLDMNTPGLSVLAQPTLSKVNIPPYVAARIIYNKFSYIFPVSGGQKILRLYFYPSVQYAKFNYSDIYYDTTPTLFDITVNNQYTLLSNFSSYAAIKGGWPQPDPPPLDDRIVREFIINIVGFEFLETVIRPSPGSFAFINGIELISLPKNLYMGTHDPTHNKRKLAFVNNPSQQFIIDQNKTAFETMARLTMGGETIADSDDTGMFREWVKDDSFIMSSDLGTPIGNDNISLTYPPEIPIYAAPAMLYKTARAMGDGKKLAWNFRVDSGYSYLLRLHFCELTQDGQGPFNVYIDGMDAGTVNVESITGGAGIPLIRDYVVLIGNPGGNGRAKCDLNLAISPVDSSGDAFLNGVEVFKLSTTDGYLAGVNPVF